MGLDSHLYLLPNDQVTNITRETQSLMPKVHGTRDEIQNLVAYLSQLKGQATETWVGTSINHPGSSTWMTGTYDAESNILYWGVGNPGPDFNGDQRKGDNLYSCSILAPSTHKPESLFGITR